VSGRASRVEWHLGLFEEIDRSGDARRIRPEFGDGLQFVSPLLASDVQRPPMSGLGVDQLGSCPLQIGFDVVDLGFEKPFACPIG
jgi:hypothetical protein